MKKLKLFLLFFLLITGLKLSAQNSKIEFTQEETDWISSHQTLNVANEMDWPPFDFVEDGKPAGYSIDLIQLIAEKTGLNIELVNGYSWNEILDLFKKGDIQILPAVYKDDERNSYMEYTSSYYSQPSVLITNRKNEFNTISDLSNKSIAVIEGFSITKELENNYPDINRVPVKSVLDGLMKVSTGELDGFVESIGVVSYYMESNFVPNLKISSDLHLDKMELPPLFISVAKDNIILRDILQKGLASISDKELNIINQRWISISVNEPKKSGNLTSLLVKTIIGVLLLFVIFYFGFKWFFKKIVKEKVALEFGSKKFRIKTNFYLSVLVIMVAGLGWLAIVYIENEFSHNIKLQLENDLGSANGRLKFWLKERKDYLKSLGRDQKLVNLTTELKEVSETFNNQKYSVIHNKLAQFFDEYQYQGSYIINEDGINMGSVDSTHVNELNNIVENQPELLKKVFDGEVVFVPPILSEENGGTNGVDDSSLMYFLIPIEDTEHHVIAAIIQEIDPAFGFSEILQLSHVGESGESYIFNQEGRMLSSSRFENDLISLGVFQLNNAGVPYIEIRDPGGNLTTGFISEVPSDQQSLTLMAKSAIEGNNSVNVDGYNDYRGVPVMGAWMWIDELELGLATEIDVEEALTLFYFIRLSAIIVLGITLVFIIGSILFVLSLGEKANLALIKAKDELEERVANRTEELSAANQQIKGIVDSLADAMIIINERGIIEFFSPSAEKMFQYKENEIKGLNISTLMPAPHKEGHNNYLNRYVNTGEAKIIGKEQEVNGVRKDGSVFPARLVVSEVNTEKKRLFVGLMSDLTERKKSNLRLRSQSAALKSAANGVVITNTNGEVVWVNPAFTGLTGYAWREVVGKNPRILNSGKHDKAFYSKMWNTIIAGKTWQGEIINKKKNGELFNEEMTITPVLDDKGNINQFVAIKNDITQRKKMEEVMRKANERMEGELNVAKDIQMSMLPLIFPAFPNREEVEIYAELIPAREVGGDFYDFHFIDENHLCFVMADVSGKGVPAALMMAVTKTLLKSRASNDKSPASILTDVNNEIAKDNDSYMFITVFLAILNTNTGELVYSNAGHNPSYIICKETKELTKLGDLHGPVIGAMEGMTYGQTKLFLKKNDIVFSYTDGVTESHNIKEELYSDPRLEELLENGNYDSSKSLTKLVIQSVNDFAGEADQFDDITAMAIEYLQNPNTISSVMSSVIIKNDLKQITTAIEWFEAFALENEMPFAIIQKINIAFDEILNNIISYGYNDNDEHGIEIEIEIRSERLIIIIRDDGIPFNPFKKDPPDTKLSVEERIIGGLGIHIVKKLMDEYEYKRQTNKNIITLIKHKINT